MPIALNVFCHQTQVPENVQAPYSTYYVVIYYLILWNFCCVLLKIVSRKCNLREFYDHFVPWSQNNSVSKVLNMSAGGSSSFLSPSEEASYYGGKHARPQPPRRIWVPAGARS